MDGTGGTADLAAEQRPLPGEAPRPGEAPLTEAQRRILMRSTEGRAALGSPEAQEYLARKRAAADMWRAKAFLAGGSQNLNSGNGGMYNQFLAMGPNAQPIVGDLTDEQRAVLQQNMPINPYRARIEEAQLGRAAKFEEAQLNRMAAQQADLGRMIVAQKLENSVPDPVKAAAVQEDQRQQQERLYAGALQHIEENYAWNPGTLFGAWFGTPFTDLEVESAIDDISTMYKIPPDEARAVVESIRNRYRARGR